MQQNPSLLDWLRVKLGHPRNQRLFRFGLAVLAGAWGAYSLLFLGKQAVGGYFFLGLALGLLFWGLSVRGEAVAAPDMPGLSFGPRPRPGLPAITLAADRETFERLLAGLRLPSALILTIAGQAVLIYNPEGYRLGLLLLALGVAAFVGNLWYDHLFGLPRAQQALAESRLSFRWGLLGLSLVTGAFGFWDAHDNTFRLAGVVAWFISVAAWLASTWEWRTTPAEWFTGVRARLAPLLRAEGLNVRITRMAALAALVLVVGAYFRFAQLPTIPPEMTSDHIEKLFDVHDLVNGDNRIYFERNTGREPIQFYFAAFLVNVFNTGFTYLTLKITSSVAGFLMLPFIFLLGRELQDDRFGLLAMAMAAISFWATAISRVGLRFPLTPLFVAPVLLFLLRGIRRHSRNDFLLSGLFMGIGLYGYSTIRIVPVALLAVLVWFFIWPQPAATRRRLIANAILMFATTFIVFLPLYRYATSPNNIFWYRSISRLGSSEQPINGNPIVVFLQNNWNGLRMFNWLGDQVWVNTLPGKPALDTISGALFLCGVAFLLARLIVRRDRVAGALLLLVPSLILASTLSLAFPDENPSVVRAGAVIPVVFLIVAYPLWLLWQRLLQVWPGATGRLLGVVCLGGLVGGAALINSNMYFVQYPAQYIGSAQNASEIGAVVHDFATTVGSYDRAWICLHPYWADTRAVGIYAGDIGWEQVMPPEEFTKLQGDPRPLLVILNPRGKQCIAAMRADFPTGKLSLIRSARGTDRDFLAYFVPGTTDLDENTLQYQ
jgi:hypothetical protein